MLVTNLNPTIRRVLWIVLIAEVLGSIYGYYWYLPQLKATPWYLWLFTWDCPFYASLFSFWLLSLLRNYRLHRSALFTAITFTGLIKYGMWTVVIVQDSYSLGASVDLQSLGLQISHFIMFIQGFFLIYQVTMRYSLIVLLWMILNDFIDYYVGTYPWMMHDQVRLAFWMATTSTFLLAGWMISFRVKSLLYNLNPSIK